MSAPYQLLLPLGLLALLSMPPKASAVDEPRLKDHRFVGIQSCSTSGCHGGGEGRNQVIIFNSKDPHKLISATLNSARSKQMGDGFKPNKIPDVTRDANCTVCHSPMESIANARFAPGTASEKGVSCESCHGPAEPWLLFHTRKDITRDQRIASGMREMKDLYNRANTCVACHLYLKPALVDAGHRELFFELAGQTRRETPHWDTDKDDPWIDGRAWVVGQATALRELAYHVAQDGANSTTDNVARVEGLRWVLNLHSGSDVGTSQEAADRLAKSAQGKSWTREGTMSELQKFLSAGQNLSTGGANAKDQWRRAQVLLRGVNAFWGAFKGQKMKSLPFDMAYLEAEKELDKGSRFDGSAFGEKLKKMQAALASVK